MRRHWSITSIVLCLELLALLAATKTGYAAPKTSISTPDQIVYPTGEFPADVENVQAAADQGGVVLLKASDAAGAPTAFNFGDLGYVVLTQDVEFQGETAGQAMTTIEGGWDPLFSIAPIDLTVKGVRFEGPLSSAMLILEANRTEIVGNQIVNIVGFPIIPGIRKGQGIWVLFVGEGEMIISDNVIADIEAELAYAVAIFGTAAATTIVDNDFRGFNTSGILVAEYENAVVIERNFVAPGPERFAGLQSLGNGISIANFSAQSGAPVMVSNNRVICDNPWATGITANGFSNNVSITGNHVTMNESVSGAITMAVGASDNYVGQNRLDGTASYALSIDNLGLYPDVNRGNLFVGNNIAQFDSAVADVLFAVEAVDTTLIGDSGQVIDEGENNVIVGLEPIDGSRRIGQSIRQAQARKLELLGTLEAEAAPMSP